MENPGDRTKQARPAGAACCSYHNQLASIGFTYEHERWALTIASTAVRWRWGCVRARVSECVWVSGMPKAKYAAGGGHRPTSTALGRQQAGSMSPIAMRQRLWAMHATPHNTPPKKTPTYPDKQSMQHALTSLSWSNPKIFYPAHFPPTSLKTHFHNTSSRASAQREYPQSNWIDPIDWQIHFITFSALYIFTWMVPLIIAKLDSDGSISYQVKISLNAKRVQCLKGLSELERIRVVAFPERRKKIIEKIKKRWLTFLFLFWTNQTSKW